MILSLYARLMCRLIWAFRRLVPASDGELPRIEVAHRDYEWTGRHVCENCGRGCRHRFVEWREPGEAPVVTAQCSNCLFEATL